jgi:protein required for attachment to host cells
MKSFSQFLTEIEVPFNYGSKVYQRELENRRTKKETSRRQQQQSNADAAFHDHHSGFQRGFKNGVPGKFHKNKATGKYDVFVPDNS